MPLLEKIANNLAYFVKLSWTNGFIFIGGLKFCARENGNECFLFGKKENSIVELSLLWKFC
jgi:hypothetical protein